MKHKETIDAINQEISSMSDKMFIRARPQEETRISFSDLPDAPRELFLELVAETIHTLRETRESDGETFDLKEELEVSLRRGTLDGHTVFCLGMHNPTSPFNPSGHDIFVRGDATFVGWTES